MLDWDTSGAEAVCGPVGNCNAVQESKFALLFGVIHVGLVGLEDQPVGNRRNHGLRGRDLHAQGQGGHPGFPRRLIGLVPFTVGT